MLLTLTTTHNPATDLGYLLHKNPAKLHSFELSFGKTYESLEALAVRELHKQFAAVTFDQAEGIELARVTLVEKGTEMTPVDFEAFPRSWLHAHIGTLGRSLQLEPRVSNLSGYSDRR